MNPSIAFIGGGNMARSLIGGLIDAGTPATAILVCEPDADSRQTLEQQFSITTSADNSDAMAADTVVLAVKPQVMQIVCEQLAADARQPLFVSIAAGIRCDALDGWLGGNRAIVRTMPNTPALIGIGATGLFANTRASADNRDIAESILASVGVTAWVTDEAQLDAITAVSGSGPAYFFLMIEAMQQAAESLGLDADTARTLVTQTALGAASMNAQSDEPASELRQRVTSKGGTTAAALASFEADQFQAMVERALTAARDRSISLAEELG